ncbi:MAG: calcium/sodium antiporter [Planctomycetota bacterium]|nr:calcium/sodium antiporter [Planctomycetota bacterium]
MTEYLLPLGWILVGLVMLSIGGHQLISGAVELAMRFKLSPLFIGITVVAAGTSLPELLVSLMAQIEGQSGLSIGNVIGSNIFNIGLVLGTVLIWTHKKPAAPGLTETIGLLIYTLLFTLYLFFVRDAQGVATIDMGIGLLMELVFVLLIFLTLRSGKKNPATEEVEQIARGARSMSIILSLVIGILGLWFGAELLVDGAVSMATILGVSDTIIGLTIVAAGTGAPEFFASIAALRKGTASMAVGNIVGSNLFNTIAIVGAAALVRPLQVDLIELRADLILNLVLALSICFLLSPKMPARPRKLVGVTLIATYLGWMASILF